jgi:hypothetical protein
MQKKRYFLACAVLLLLVSCLGRKNDNSVPRLLPEIKQDIVEETVQASLNISLSEEEVRFLLEKNERRITELGAEIVFIERANFGISGGDNWVVRLSDKGLLIYAIGSNRIEKRYYLVSFDSEERSAFDIMQNIPGRHIGNSTSSIGDFNGDGIDEIFQYGFGGMGNVVLIWFYNLATDDFRTYCDIPFRIIDPDIGPAPVEFMTYQGMYGFMVYYFQYNMAGGFGSVSEAPSYKNDTWIFFAWDEEKKEYIEVGEMIDEDSDEPSNANEFANSEINNNEL